MADNIRSQAAVDIGLATTGIAGPKGGTKEKPVGLVYVAIASPISNIVKKFQFNGTRLENKKSTLIHTLALMKEYLNQYEKHLI